MKRLAVVGNGMAGIACVEQVLKLGHDFDITIFGDETHVNYNRILLSSVLAGEKDTDDIVLNDIDWYRKHRLDVRLGVRVMAIDPANRTIDANDGSRLAYDNLILATGSKPLIPRIEGHRKDGVYVFRTLDDTRALIARTSASESGAPLKAVVIGGGLLGLEAARGLQVRGCDVTVVHRSKALMSRQLDLTGGTYLRRAMESLGIRVLLERNTAAITGNGHVKGVRFSSGEEIAADLVVIAAGIRPNAELAAQCGLEVNDGIVVNDYLETSDPHIYAVGECTEHRGVTFGLVAPLYDQARVLAARLTKSETSPFEGATLATRLKILGVDVFSAGSFDESEPGIEAIRFEDAALGVYRKVLLKDNKLHGVILIGDTSDESRYKTWLRTGEDLSGQRRSLLFPLAGEDGGIDIAAIPDSETVCGCMGVTKGAVIEAIHAHSITTIAELKDRTRAGAGCGTCTGTCSGILKAVCPDFSEEGPNALCACVPFTQDQLREIIRSQKLKSVQDVLDIYGNGRGCEICKPALSWLVDVAFCGGHNEDRSARFINDRVHANIQKDGTFSVVPRMRGGITTPDELRRIADVADKYHVPMVKVTGSQRIDLLGVKKADLPKIWDELGMPSGQAYTKGVRMVKTCVGSDFCRFGTQQSISTGIELERRLENLYTPHKFKMAVVGCPRNCAEATVKDVGLIGQEGSWQVVVGGAAGKIVRKADLLIAVETTEEALEAAMIFFQYYRENASYLERTYDFVERLGIEKLRKETIYAAHEVKEALLDRLKKSKDRSYDAWLERHEPMPSQFVQIQPMETVLA
jgi:nitrite reductase (NADH) large subunit